MPSLWLVWIMAYVAVPLPQTFCLIFCTVAGVIQLKQKSDYITPFPKALGGFPLHSKKELTA